MYLIIYTRAEKQTLNIAIEYHKKTKNNAMLHWFTHSRQLVRHANKEGIFVSVGPTAISNFSTKEKKRKEKKRKEKKRKEKKRKEKKRKEKKRKEKKRKERKGNENERKGITNKSSAFLPFLFLPSLYRHYY
jgi:hypothetical protein